MKQISQSQHWRGFGCPKTIQTQTLTISYAQKTQEFVKFMDEFIF